MRLTNKTSAFLAAAMLVGAFVGCGEKKPDGLPPLQPATLTFTVDGKGLAKANITLQPVDAKANKWVPTGITDENGKAEIKTGGNFKGAPEGDYKIVVSADEEIDYGEYGPPPKDDPDALEKWNRSVDPTKFKRFSPVELKYTNVAETPLTITIQSGKNEQSFDLGSSTHEEVQQDKK